jgi:hypothetical protein
MWLPGLSIEVLRRRARHVRLAVGQVRPLRRPRVRFA